MGVREFSPDFQTEITLALELIQEGTSAQQNKCYKQMKDHTGFDCRIPAGNGGKLRCSQAELTQTIKAAVDMFASIFCRYPKIEGGTCNSKPWIWSCQLT